MSLLPRLATSFAALLIGLRFFSSTALAVQNPEAFYDWGPYYNQTERKVLGIAVLAETDEATPAATPTEQAAAAKVDYADIQRYHGYFLFGGLSPDNPFYFLKTSQEGVRLAFTFNSEAKDKLRVEFAGERMVEIQSLVDQGKTGSLTGPIRNYENHLVSVTNDLEKLNENGKDVTDLLTHVQTETAKHNLVLQEVEAKLPDSAESLEKAQFAAEKVGDVIADLQGLPSLPPDVLARLQALKAQGLLTPEEVNKIVAIKTRTEVRDELRKMVEQGVIPEADLYKLNENVKVIFPEQFNKVVELQKLEELRRLETQKPDEETLKRMQDFAKDYKPGDIIPPDIKKYWGPTVRLQEIQSTIRVDFIDGTIIQNNKDLYQKYQEIVARSKPSDNEFKRAQELTLQYAREGKAVPPEVSRVLEFGYKFGTGNAPSNVPPQYIPSSFFQKTAPKSCEIGKYWIFNSTEGGGGHCEGVPNFEQYSDAFRDLPNQPVFPAVQDCPEGYQLSGSSCTITAEYKAKNPAANPTAERSYTPGTTYPNPYPNPYYPQVQSCPQGQYYQYNGGGGSCKSAPGSDPNTSPTGGTPPPGYQPQPINCPTGWTYSSTSYGGFGGCVQNSGGSSGTSGGSNPAPTGSASCGSGSYWNGSSCSPTTGGGSSGSSCPSGQYWNGSSCVSSGGTSGGYTTPAYPTPATTYTTPPSTYTSPPSEYTTPPSTYTSPPAEYPTPYSPPNPTP